MKKILISAIALGLVSFDAHAIPFGTYDLGSHPGGSAATPYYGLRLDGLKSPGIWTFDFDHADSAMEMTYFGDEINISGVTAGGLDSGGSWSSTGLFAIDFTYKTQTVGAASSTVAEVANGGVDDTTVHIDFPHNDLNTGWIQEITGGVLGDRWELRDHSKPSGLSMQLGDEGGSGHRGFSGISGWGWLDYSADGGTTWSESGGVPGGSCCKDWLFTATKKDDPPQTVAEPLSGALFGTGVLTLAALRRRVGC